MHFRHLQLATSLAEPGSISQAEEYESYVMNTRLEKSIGLLIGALGLIWGLYHVIYEVHALGQELDPGFLRLGPMQTMMLGLILWLHGRYRQAVDINRA